MSRGLGGIGKIEQKIKDRQEITDKQISSAFQDLNKLMDMAQQMVELSKGITKKLKDKGNDISKDETVVFKSHLLSLGISDQSDDPVVRSQFSSDNKYYLELGKQIEKIVKPIIEESGGQMSLTDVFCTVNRARGFDLISVEDLLNACSTFELQNYGLKCVKYKSGLIVLQSNNYNQNSMNNKILDLLETNDSVSGQELALSASISLALARQRLFDCENIGIVCRDESIYGLRFFPNKFV
ncbi:vacuolar protein-sorting-associated protein 36-like [Oppia nitens]|uniref:vacuolar protein-sorting-associated protein 36-like n=1 Tax=Oppia nitens TaxID=1686743 RepID=UPI0023DB0347|nr:vacuolar protein-sorting-associated protein 36-like [Oppia nitens]